MFRQPRFEDEVNDWLQNRATASDAQRFERYIKLIEQAARSGTGPGSPVSSSKTRPASTLGFSPKKTPQQLLTSSPGRATHERAASASPNSSNWVHTATRAAAGRLAASPVGSPKAGLTSQGGRAYSPRVASAVPSAARADLQQPADNNSSSLAAAGAGHSSPKSVNVTTAQAMHGLKDLYPDLWANTVPICRPDPAPNKNFVSEWGESLRQGAAEAWAPYLASTYQVANLQVAKPTDEFAVRADEALVNWSNKQKLYFGDLLSPQAAAAVERLLEGKPLDATSSTGLPVADRKGLVEMLRQLNGVVKPDSQKSTMQSSYKPQYSVEDTETTSLMKEQTRVKTMGFPRKVEVKGCAHVKAAGGSPRAGSASPVAGSSGSPAGSPTRRGHKGPKASEMIDTFGSKVPLKWASTAVGAPTSSYTASFGGNPGHAPQMHKTVFKEVNVGYGHVDQHMYPSGSAVYPVEQLYVQQTVIPGEEQKAADMKTTQRMSYKPRDPESVSRSIAAAQEQIEASQAARNKSTIPLSKAGIQLGNSSQWSSAYDADFIERKADLSANKSMASAVAGMFNGPTIAYGKIAGIRPEDEAKISKHKAQQAAAAAARAQADAELDKRAAAAGK